jgi:hypothetical protein
MPETKWYQVQVLISQDDPANHRGYPIWKVLAELERHEADYEVSELHKAGKIARCIKA